MTLVTSMVIAASGVAAAEVSYPGNPYVGQADTYISFDGVHAYSQTDSQKRWTALQGEHTFELVVHDNVLLIGSSSGLYALRSTDGSVLWHVEAANEIFTPVIVDGIAYAGSRNGTLYAIDANNGHEKWRRIFPGWVYSPAFIDGVLVTGGQDATLWALNSTNGTQRWSLELPGELVFRTVTGAPTTVLAVTFAADLIAIDTLNGGQQWRLQTPTANMTPTVSGTRILLVGLDGSLRKVDLDTGTVDWDTQLRGRLSSPLLIGDDRVIVGNDEGDVFLLNQKTGSMISQTHLTGDAVGTPFIHHGNVFQFFQNSGQLSIVAAAEISVDRIAEN